MDPTNRDDIKPGLRVKIVLKKDQPTGELTLHEHQAACWLPAERLHTLDWAEADLPLIAALAPLT